LSLQSSRVSRASGLRRFTRNNLQHPTYRALTELGKAVRTVFLCRNLSTEALRREIGHFAAEMSADFAALNFMPHLGSASRLMIAEIVVQITLDAAAEILDVPPGRPDIESELVDRLVRSLIVVLLGAQAWRDKAR